MVRLILEQMGLQAGIRMIYGIGIDIIEIVRIKKSINKYGDAFINKIFTKNEIEYCINKPNIYQHFAARFAGKEAVAKALSTMAPNGFNWKDIEIYNLENGLPQVKLFGKLAGFIDQTKSLMISMSHSDKYVTCFAIIYHNRLS